MADHEPTAEAISGLPEPTRWPDPTRPIINDRHPSIGHGGDEDGCPPPDGAGNAHRDDRG